MQSLKLPLRTSPHARLPTASNPTEAAPMRALLCWPHDQHLPRLPRVTWQDCGPLVESMREGDKRFAEIHFSRDAKRGYQLPHTMQHRTCRIDLRFNREDGVEDDYKFRELSFLADAIVKECVIALGSLRAGGVTHFGRRNKMSIVIRGVNFVDPDARLTEKYVRRPEEPEVVLDISRMDPAVVQRLMSHREMLGLG